jgi:hypothetical protein
VHKDLTYSEAIEKVILDNGGCAPLKYIYDNIEKYRKKTGLTPDNSIQERVQRDNRFTRIAKGIYALTDFINKVENSDDKYIEFGWVFILNVSFAFKTKILSHESG